MFKNVASQKVIVFAFDATTNVPKTGDAAQITAYVSKDFGAVTVLGDTSATEMDATNAPGYYLFDITQTETNADCILVSGKSSTSNIKVIGAPATIFTFPATGILAPTTAGRTLDVTATGEAGIDWSNVGAPTTALALTGTTIAVTQKVDVDTIKTNPVVNGGTITFPTNKTLADTTSAVGSVTGAVGSIGTGGIAAASFAAGAIDAAAIAANAIGASELATDAVAEIAAGVWGDTTAGDFTVAASVGKSIMNGVALGTGLTVAAVSGAVGSVTGAVGSVTGAVGSVTGAVGSVTGLTASDVGTIKTKTDQLTFTNANKVDATALTIATNAVDAAALAADAGTELADALLARNVSGGSSAGRTVKQALHAMRNKVDIAAGTMTVYDVDDTSASWTAAVTTTAGNPISTVDPA